MREKATYQEIVRFWDLKDVLEANEWLDYLDDAEYFTAEQMRAEMKKA
jgi:hypothetical protein